MQEKLLEDVVQSLFKKQVKYQEGQIDLNNVTRYGKYLIKRSDKKRIADLRTEKIIIIKGVYGDFGQDVENKLREFSQKHDCLFVLDLDLFNAMACATEYIAACTLLYFYINDLRMKDKTVEEWTNNICSIWTNRVEPCIDEECDSILCEDGIRHMIRGLFTKKHLDGVVDYVRNSESNDVRVINFAFKTFTDIQKNIDKRFIEFASITDMVIHNATIIFSLMVMKSLLKIK